MDLFSIAQWAEESSVAVWMRESLHSLPSVAALHIIGATIVFGTIFFVDLRLLGLPSTKRPFTRVAHEALKWTWVAFVLAFVTGVMMTSAAATSFFEQREWWIKMGLLVAAGINMAIFQFVTFRNVESWDANKPTPPAAKLAGVLSILFWLSIIFMGRWIGYTKDTGVEGTVDFDIDSLFM